MLLLLTKEISLPMKKNSIENYMTEYPTIASPRMTVTEASEYMQKCGFRHLPIVDKGEVLGIVSDRNLKQAELLADAMTLVVADVMTPKPYCVRVGTPLAQVARHMARERIGSAIILNSFQKVVGIFTTTDAMQVLANILETDNGPNYRLMSVEELLDAKYAGLSA